MRIRPWIGRIVLRIYGWAPEGELPTERRFVLVAAPHTTNWDLLFFLALAWVYGVHPNWMGKHTLFKPPWGTIMRLLGGVPVRRDRRNDLVKQMADIFVEAAAAGRNLILTIPPEGTRGGGTHWKSGFYRIAEAAGVPIVLGFLDYARRRGGFGPSFVPSGDVRADMDRVRAFYAEIKGKFPEHFTPPLLREEAEATA